MMAIVFKTNGSLTDENDIVTENAHRLLIW